MNQKNAVLASMVLVAALLISTLAACGTAGPSTQPQPAPASPSASASAPQAAQPSASPSASSPVPSSASPSAKAPSAQEQAYQKAQENWPKVLEAARQETNATIYGVNDLDFLKTLMTEFNKLDPKIQMQLVRLQGAAAAERLKAEQATKQYVSSGYLGGSPTARTLDEQGLVQGVDDLPNLYAPGDVWVASPLLDKPHNTLTYAFARYYLLVNTGLVPAGQEPKTWRALGDPQWKDRLLLWEPRNAGYSRSMLALLYTLPSYGPDVVRKIVENSRVESDSSQLARAVAKGEAALGMTTYTGFQPIKEAPVKLWTPEDGMIAGPAQFIMMKNAPAPNTTRVFFNWLLSREGQKVLSSMGTTLVRKDVDEVVPGTNLKGQALMPGVPVSWDFELKQMNEAGAVFGKWYDELGK